MKAALTERTLYSPPYNGICFSLRDEVLSLGKTDSIEDKDWATNPQANDQELHITTSCTYLYVSTFFQ